MRRFTTAGVSTGLAWTINATVADTTGAAMLVPLRLKYGGELVATEPQIRAAGRPTNNVLPGSASDSMPTPGATTSGFCARSIRLGPSELNGATESSRRSAVPLWLEAPTVKHPGGIARRRDPAELWLSPVVPAMVPRGGHHHDAGVDGAPCGQRQRVCVVRLVDPGRHREIDHADVESRPLLDRVVDRRNRVADVAVAVLVERPQDEQVRPWCDPPSCAVRVVTVAGDDSGDVRAMAVAVVRLGLEVDEVDELRDPVAAQVVVRACDPRIDDGHANASAVHAQVLGHPAGADGQARALERAVKPPVRADGLDRRRLRELGQRGLRDLRDQGPDSGQPPPAPAAKSPDERLHGAEITRPDDDPRHLAGHGGSPPQSGVQLANRGRLGSGGRPCC